MFSVFGLSGARTSRGLFSSIGALVPTVVLMLFLMRASTVQALPAPPAFDASPNPCCGVSFAQYGLGFSGSDLFIHTGDTLYKLGLDSGGNEEWQVHLPNIQDAFSGPTRVFEGGFATSPVGTAAISMGFNDGGVLLVDLADPASTSEVTALNFSNVFSLAGAPNGDFFGMVALSDFSTLTQLVRIDGGSGDVEVILNEVDPGSASGGMAFDVDGNLIASSFDFVNGKANFFRVDAADLGNPMVTASLIASVDSNGNSNVVANAAGDIFFISETGVGVIRKGSTVLEPFFGDLTLSPFGGAPISLSSALAIDPVTQELILIDRSNADPVFVRLATGATTGAIPEPSSALLALFGLAGLAMGRRRV